LAVGSDHGDVPVRRQCGNFVDNRIVAVPGCVHDPNPVTLTHGDARPGRSLEDEDDRGDKTASAEGVEQLSLKVPGCGGAVPPPTRRPGAHNVGRIHHEHDGLCSGLELRAEGYEHVQLCPFLLFEGNCAEAMQFYQSCLGGDLSITRVGDTPTVAYARLVNGAMEISATDWQHPTRQPRPGNTVALYLHLGSYEQLRAVFDRLAVGAAPDLLDELRQMPFGTYGHLADRYGVHWFFQGDSAAR
jgi:PhnB protein